MKQSRKQSRKSFVDGVKPVGPLQSAATAPPMAVLVLPWRSALKVGMVIEVGTEEVTALGRLLGAVCGGRRLSPRELQALKPLAQGVCRAWMQAHE